MGRSRWWILCVAISLVVVACDASTDGTPPTESPAQPRTGLAGCPEIDGQSWTDGQSATLEQIGSTNGVDIYAAEYPLPGPTDGLWSQWGQGVALADGTHISAVGDHRGVDGNSWFFEYDPEARSLTRLFDVQSVVPSSTDSWGYGKIHAQMVVDDCGSVWAATYWGTRTEIFYDDVYVGDRLLQIDVTNNQVIDHGAIAGERGLPAMAMAEDGTIVAVAVDAKADTAILTSYDPGTNSVLGNVDDPRQTGFRSLGPTQHGLVTYSIGGSALAEVDDDGQTTRDLDPDLPGTWLRAATGLTDDLGWFGVTQEDPELFFVDTDGMMSHLGSTNGYTTSLAMTDAGDQVFWLPGAHGNSSETGSTILSYSSETGEISEVVSLAPLFEEELGLLSGGTYSIVYDNGTLILGVNASDPNVDDSGFGTVVLVVIEGL